MLMRILGIAALILASTITVTSFHHLQERQPSPGCPDPASAPELNPSVLGGGLTLLTGGALLLAERRRARR
jgi:hypothetical protein